MHEFNSCSGGCVSCGLAGERARLACWQRRLAFANFSMSPLLNFSSPKRRLFWHAKQALTGVVLRLVLLLT